jgi:hypothetical protein
MWQLCLGTKLRSMPEGDQRKLSFDREAWRRRLEELEPAARAAMAKVAAEKDQPSDLDIDRMVVGLGAEPELDEQ